MKPFSSQLTKVFLTSVIWKVIKCTGSRNFIIFFEHFFLHKISKNGGKENSCDEEEEQNQKGK